MIKHRHKRHHRKHIRKYALGGLVNEKDFPPKFQEFMNSHGSEVITTIKVCREPVNSKVMEVMNAISLGSLEKVRKRVGADKFFHLYLVLNGKYILEKNQVLSIREGTAGKDAECVDVVVKNPKSLQEMVDLAHKRMGNDMFIYNAFSLNCQNFVKRFLIANLLPTPSYFIDAPMQKILEGIPGYVPVVTKGLTDLAAIFTLLGQKLGINV